MNEFIYKILTVFIVVVMSVPYLFAQNLWQDHNPYGSHRNLRQGTILKLNVDEPVRIRYEYENMSDEDITIKIVPDQSLTPFLPPADSTKSITNKTTADVESDSHIRFRMAVTVSDDVENETVTFTGTKLLAQENGRTRQLFQVSGRVHIGDIQPGRRIDSEAVADLQITVTGLPIPQTKDIPLKTVPGENPGDPAVPSAELSEREQQQLLLEYLNRVLGEGGEQ